MNDSEIVIFGANGDLSARKLFPAFYHLEHGELLSTGVRLICLARDSDGAATFVDKIKIKVKKAVRETHWNDNIWEKLAKRIQYITIDFDQVEGYKQVVTAFSHCMPQIFYLATPPGLFSAICEHLNAAGCINQNSRIVLEKPIGENLSSCQQVNDTVARYFPEDNIYRIDHYLGKETVQNLLILRFANRFINTQWDQSCVDHVQITVAETVGIEGRWRYYDNVGQLRDMMQNHLMQLLCLVAMEPPNAMTAEAIRDEKVKIIRALRRIDNESVSDHAVRGQYTAGLHNGDPVAGYLDEASSESKSSETETFVAVKAFIDNWRWSGVPFYLRTGKRMPEKRTEIVITYKALPHNIFSSEESIPNQLVIRLQPNEGIEMQMVSKRHSLRDKMALERQTLDLDFLRSSGSDRIPDAYERLFLDVMNADQSLFVGREEIEESWRWCDQLITAWQSQSVELKAYQAGSWGPISAELLIEKDERSWHG